VTGRHLLALSGLLLGAVLGTPAHAQEAQSTAAQELAKDALNPFADFIKLPVQFTTGFGVGPRHHTGESINVQPVLPVSLSAEWDLLFRPSVTATYLPGPGAQFGLADLQASLFLTPAGATKWIWGLGPIVQLPTATTDKLGTGRWSAGRTAALIYSSGPWLSGVLTYHLASFAGDRHRSSVSQTYVEPQVSYSFCERLVRAVRSRSHIRLDRRLRRRVEHPHGGRRGRCAHDRRSGDELPARRVRLPEAPGRDSRVADPHPGDTAFSRRTLVHRRGAGIKMSMARAREFTDGFGLVDRDHVDAIWTAGH
jgi:hypothetical protein